MRSRHDANVMFSAASDDLGTGAMPAAAAGRGGSCRDMSRAAAGLGCSAWCTVGGAAGTAADAAGAAFATYELDAAAAEGRAGVMTASGVAVACCGTAAPCVTGLLAGMDKVASAISIGCAGTGELMAVSG